MGIPADYKNSDYAGKVPVSPAVLMLPLTKEQLASQEFVGGDAKQLEWALIKLTHVSENACVSGRSNASGIACISRCSIHTVAPDRLKKEVQLVGDMAVCALPSEPQ